MLQPFAGFTFRGLRGRLLAIVLLAVVPLALILLGYVGVQSNAAQSRANAEVQHSLENDVRSLQDTISETRATLVTFGITFAIQAQDWRLVRGNTNRLKAEHPDYSVIAVADETGRVRAASAPLPRGGLNISNEEWYRRALASKALTVSRLQRDPVTGKPSIIVSLPVYNQADRLRAVEYVALDATQLGTRIGSGGAATVTTLLDSSGVVVLRRPSLPSVEGRPMNDAPLVQTVLAQKKGEATVPGLAGVMRSYHFAPVLQGADSPLYLAVGFSPDEIFASDRRNFVITAVLFGIVAVLALLVAWLVGTYSIYAPALQLRQAAEKLSAGDLSARANVGTREDEFGQLGEEFNEMADTIQTHVTELETARNELSELNEELEDRVRRRTAELEASNKELEAFSYSVSHDLRSPLRAIDGFSLALLEDYADLLDAQGREDLARVRQNASRMGDLIDSLLRLSRLSRQEMKVAEVDLSGIAREVAASLSEVEPERNVVFVIEPDVCAEGDSQLLRIVLENLMGNAWKFTSKHPSATIEFGRADKDGETAYYVRDDGAGFDMAYVDKLFGAFQRVHGQNEFPGIGIGLATSARIIHRHGGRIWAEGESEKGATFWFTLA